MLQGFLFSVLAGLFIALQSIFNARLGEAAGLWPSNAFVHGSGFLLALFILLTVSSDLSLTSFTAVKPHYLLGGALGVGIIFSVMQGVSLLGASFAIAVIIVTQVLVTFVINYFGIFGEPVIEITLTRIVGLVMMIAGFLLYQLH